MTLAPNLLRRGANYSWRRRVPISVICALERFPQDSSESRVYFRNCSLYFQIALGTASPKEARTLAHVLNFASERMFTMLEQRGLTQDQKALCMRTFYEEEVQRINLRLAVQHGDTPPRDGATMLAPSYGQHNSVLDQLTGEVFKLLAKYGGGAKFDPKLHPELRARNFSKREIKDGQFQINLYRQDFFKTTPGLGRYGNPRLNAAASRAEELGINTLDSVTVCEIRRLSLMAKALAYLNSKDSFENEFEALSAVTNEKAICASRTFANSVFSAPNENCAMTTPLETKDLSTPKMEEPQNAYSSLLTDILELHISDKISENSSKKTIKQITQCTRLFMEITETRDLQEIRQFHLSNFVDTMRSIPSSYRKSEKDKDKPIKQIIAEADQKCEAVERLSGATINRNLTFINGLFNSAAMRGIEADSKINISILKQKKPKDAEPARDPFTKSDIQNLFRAPLWQGCSSKQVRTRPGKQVIKDAYYWLPILGAFTGARRAELAGLCRNELIQVDGIWCFDIRKNDVRRIKNKTSKRCVPIHSQIIELGFMEYAKPSHNSKEPIFPRFKKQKDDEEHGKEIGYTFRKLVDQWVENPQKKCFHSLRHYISTTLGNNPEVSLLFKDEVLGHRSPGIGNSRYYGGTEIQNLKAAIESLPRIAALEEK